MTAREAIDVIRSECYVFNALNFDRSTMVNTALDMAVKALEQEPCEDCVSREAAHNLIIPWLNDYLLDETREALETIDYKIEDLPSVTAQPKMGRWTYIQYDGNHRIGNWRCSLCMRNVMFGQNQNDKPLYNYCPHCGAKMSNTESDL